MKTQAMLLAQQGEPLIWEEVEIPDPGEGEVLLQVLACGVCRTDLHVVDGDLPDPRLPLIPGHEIVGRVLECGAHVNGIRAGDRVGVAWLGQTCGGCSFCRGGRENLCDHPLFTGYTKNGGFAQHTLAVAQYCFPLPDAFDDVHVAPLLCAGLIGFRCYRFAPGTKLGIYGFGAAAHILVQVALADKREIYAFTRSDDESAQCFAREMGAVWAGSSAESPPELLDAAIIFAPVGDLVPLALKSVQKGGVVVAGGIHMSDIPSFPYRILWEERSVRSVANLTRQDGIDFFARVARVPIHVHTHSYALKDANQALSDLREGRINGAAVLVP